MLTIGRLVSPWESASNAGPELSIGLGPQRSSRLLTLAIAATIACLSCDGLSSGVKQDHDLLIAAAKAFYTDRHLSVPEPTQADPPVGHQIARIRPPKWSEAHVLRQLDGSRVWLRG